MEELGEDNTIYNYDQEAMDALNSARPWKEDPYYFKKVRISGSPGCTTIDFPCTFLPVSLCHKSMFSDMHIDIASLCSGRPTQNSSSCAWWCRGPQGAAIRPFSLIFVLIQTSTPLSRRVVNRWAVSSIPRRWPRPQMMAKRKSESICCPFESAQLHPPSHPCCLVYRLFVF